MSTSQNKHRRILTCALSLSLIGFVRLAAQTANPTVSGTVTATTGAAVPAAAIEVKNLDIGVTRSASTDEEGRFQISDLPIGNYEVQASKAGFTTAAHRGVILSVGSQTVVDFSLPVGPTQQTITVEGMVSQVETNSSAVSSMIDQAQLSDLPLNGRSFVHLLNMTPGVSMGTMGIMGMMTAYGSGENFSISGARAEGQAFLLDSTNIQGFWNRGTGSGAVGTTLGVEAVSGFQVLTNTYSAQFGGNGAVLNAATKSGTNSLHGSVYEYLRNSALDARKFIDGSDPPPFRGNQFGASAGGPIKKDKVFFFFNYEGVRQSLGQTMISFVPDANVHQGIVPGVSSPIPIDPRIKPILDLYPLPNGPLIGGGVGMYSSVASNLANENYFVARGDWNISSKDALFARYVSDRGDFLQPFQGSSLPLWPEQDQTANQYLTLEERRILSSSAVNLLRFSFVRPVEATRTTAGTSALQFFPGLGREDASLYPGGGVSGVGANPFIPFAWVQNKFNYADDATWTRGAHTFHFGGSVERIQTNTANPPFQGGQYTFNNLGDFLQGIPATFLGVAPKNGDSTRDFREIDFTTYFQDEWKLAPRLTLNLGMRYELGTNPTGVRHPLFAIADPPNGTGFTKVSNVFSSSPNQKNLDPRFGFAWEPFDDHKTSVHGGFGIFHDRVAPRTYTVGYTFNAPYEIDFLFGPSFPSPYANVSLPAGPLSTNFGALYKLDTAPYQMQWNLNLQREVFSNTVFTIGYVASRGVHLFVPRDLNPPLPVAGPDGLPRYGTLTPFGVFANPRINPAFGNLNYDVPEGNSNYNSLQVSLNRRMARHVTAMLSYTWSKCIDNGSGTFLLEEGEQGLSNPYNARADRGLCTFDLRSNFRGDTVVSLPFRRNPLVRGWQASAIVMANTGRPFSVTDGFDQAGFQSNFQNTRPDAVAGCHAILGKANQWYDPGCFHLEPVGRPGNLGRDTLTGPGLFTTDFALLKDTRITESASLQFRAEFFNIFNHTNLGLPDGNLYVPLPATGGGAPNPTAGQIITTATTSRQIQFALKLLF